MNQTPPTTPRGGQILALLGIILAAFGLRTAVPVISPIADRIAADISFGSLGLGVIGMLPPIAFATFALLTPAIVRRLGLERSMVLALIAMAIGHALRGIAPEYVTLVLGSIVVLVGTGISNVLVPPLVRRYFPTRIGVLTSLVGTLMSISTAVPAALAAPIASEAGWRVAVGGWSLLSLAALVPWVALAVHARRAESDAPVLAEAQPSLLTAMRHSRTAWSTGIVFASASVSAYAMFAWLPQILLERTSLDEVAAGGLLSLFGIAGFPVALLMPILAVRLRNVSWLVYLGVGLSISGYLGLLLVPGVVTFVWVLLVGFGTLMFPLSLALIALRSRTQSGAVALSGFVQGLGYTVGAIGPLLVGLLHQLTGSYTAPLVVLVVLFVPVIFAGYALSKPRYVEDEIAERGAASAL